MMPYRGRNEESNAPMELEREDITGRIDLGIRSAGQGFERTLKRLHVYIVALGIFVGGGFVASERLHAYAKDEDMRAVQQRLTVIETRQGDTNEQLRETNSQLHELVRVLGRRSTP